MIEKFKVYSQDLNTCLVDIGNKVNEIIDYVNQFEPVEQPTLVYYPTDGSAPPSYVKPSDISDIMTLTMRDIDDLTCDKGGFARDTIHGLGLTYPLERGWKERLIGTMISRADYLSLYKHRNETKN
jgi:hypothetical protein